MDREISIFLLLIAWLFIQSCTISSCPESDGLHDQINIISLNVDAENPEWKEDFTGDGYVHYDLQNYMQVRWNTRQLHRLDNYFLSNDRFKEEDRLFDIEQDDVYYLPAYLEGCSFSGAVNQFLCVINKDDTLYNSYADTTLFIKDAASFLVHVSVKLSNFSESLAIDTLFQTHANFLSKDRYSVKTYHNPTYKNSEEFFYQETEEVHKLVFDSTGTIVNDIHYYREINQYRFQNSAELVIQYGELKPRDALPYFTYSDDTMKYLYIYLGKMYLQDNDGLTTVPIGTGKYPAFFNNGQGILFYKNGSYTIFDIKNNSIKKLPAPEIQIATGHPTSGEVYFLEGTRLKVFKMGSGDVEEVSNLEIFETFKDSQAGSSSGYSLYPQYIYFNKDNLKQLNVVLFSNYYCID